MKSLALYLIKVYRYLFSPLLGKHCRFHPSCSKYTEQAITHYGFMKGSYLGIKRILRCNPWSKGGYDPVPGLEQYNEANSSEQINP